LGVSQKANELRDLPWQRLLFAPSGKSRCCVTRVSAADAVGPTYFASIPLWMASAWKPNTTSGIDPIVPATSRKLGLGALSAVVIGSMIGSICYRGRNVSRSHERSPLKKGTPAFALDAFVSALALIRTANTVPNRRPVCLMSVKRPFHVHQNLGRFGCPFGL
jgi:hypothetical protein